MLDKVANLLNNAIAATEQQLGTAKRNSSLKLETAQTAIAALAFESYIAHIAIYSHPCGNLSGAQIALRYTG
jgi:hypothetical protein